jgi:hypothetical protein
MADAILNLDLDFFTQPAYLGSHYLFQEHRSYSDFAAKAKNWLDLDVFAQKMNLKRTRGCSVGEDKQVIFFYQKLIEDKFLDPKKTEIIHVDAHHDMYDYFGEGYYDSIDLHNFQNFNYLFALKRLGLTSTLWWVYPDYIEKDSAQLDTSAIDFIEIKKVQWKHFNASFYDWKYISLVLNQRMAKIPEEMLVFFKKYLSIW